MRKDFQRYLEFKMVSISSQSGSTDGVIFQELPESDFHEMVPRVSKTAALDGGTVFDHRGFVNGDREFRIKAKDLTSEQAANLILLMQNETFTNISCPAGFFSGVIARMSTVNGLLDMTYWVKEKFF